MTKDDLRSLKNKIRRKTKELEMAIKRLELSLAGTVKQSLILKKSLFVVINKTLLELKGLHNQLSKAHH